MSVHRAAQPVSAVAAANRPKPDQHGFIQPEPWTYDDGRRREPVLDVDHSPPRVVRRVGWRSCMGCGKPFVSENVVGLRLCNGPKSCREVLAVAVTGEPTTPATVLGLVHRAEA